MNKPLDLPKMHPNADATEKLSAPETSITSAVSVQQIIVSRKTSKTLHIPITEGDLSATAPCIIGELPRPASFEKMPRLMPMLTVLEIEKPPIPPTAELTFNASLKIFIRQFKPLLANRLQETLAR